MQINQNLRILKNEKIACQTYQLTLEGNFEMLKAGQFVNLMIESCYLRRPLSICSKTDTILTLVYKVVGKGTKILSEKNEGLIDALIGLGNGFSLKNNTDVLLVGGGLGIVPLYQLAKDLIINNNQVKIVLGYSRESDIFLLEAFKQLDIEVVVCTLDGSFGFKGNVVDYLNTQKITQTYYYTCGPKAMMQSLHEKLTIKGELSFEEKMGCGFGACMGCTCKTKYGNKRICKEGPVLLSEEVIW